MGAPTWALVALCLVAVATGANLRRHGRRSEMDMQSALATLEQVAIKYDCHKDETNMIDLLKNVRLSNAKAFKRIGANCTAAGEAIDAENAVAHAEVDAESNRTARAFQAVFVSVTRKAEGALQATLELHTANVNSAAADVEAAEAKVADVSVAHNRSRAVHKAVLAEGAYAVATATAMADRERNESATDRDTAIAEATEIMEGQLSNAAHSFKVAMQICNHTIAQHTATLKGDAATVEQISGFVAKLNLCAAGAKPATAGSRAEEKATAPAKTDIALFLELDASKLETAACARAATSLQEQAQSGLGNVDVTGDVAAMKRRLEERTTEYATQFDTCKKIGKDVRNAASGKATRAQRDISSKAHEDYRNEVEKADNKLALVVGDQLDMEVRANATYVIASDTFETAVADLDTMRLVFADAKKGMAEAGAWATKKRDAALLDGNATLQMGLKMDEENAGEAKANADVAALASQAGLAESCKAQRDTNREELDLVDDIYNNLASIKIVNTEEQATKAAARANATRLRRDREQEERLKVELKVAEEGQKAAALKEAREAEEKIKRDEEAVKAGEKAETDKRDAKILEESKKAAAKLQAARNRELEVLAKNKEEETKKEALEKEALRLEMERTKLVAEKQAKELQEVAAKEAEAKVLAATSGSKLDAAKKELKTDTARFKQIEDAENRDVTFGDTRAAAHAEMEEEIAGAAVTDASSAEHSAQAAVDESRAMEDRLEHERKVINAEQENLD